MRQFRFAQKAFIVDNGKLLLVKKSKDDPYHPGEWEVPGGGKNAIWGGTGGTYQTGSKRRGRAGY